MNSIAEIVFELCAQTDIQRDIPKCNRVALVSRSEGNAARQRPDDAN